MPASVIIYIAITFVNVGIGSFLYKKAQILGIRPGSFMTVQAFSFMITVATALLIRGEPVKFCADFGFGVITGIFGIIGALAVLFSLKNGELGINTAVVRLSFIPTVIGAFIFLNEEITVQKIMILMLGLVSIFLFADHYRKNNPIALPSLVPAFTACLSFGIFDLMYKAASLKNIDPLAFIFIQTLTANVLVNLYVIFSEKYSFNKAVLTIAPVCGVLFGTGCITFIKALAHVDISLISPVLQMNFMLTYILGVILLKESITPRKIIGIGCVFIAIVLLSIS